MTEIIPAINVDTFDEVVRRIKMTEGHAVPMVHIDVADGSFTPKAVWHAAEDLKKISLPLAVEIHFMVREPEKKIGPWLTAPISRIIFHVEAAEDPRALMSRIRGADKKAGVAICPETPCETLVPFIDKADLLLLLAVSPGPSHQEFDRTILKKISFLREKAPQSIIEVDGGIKIGIAKECACAGASALAVASALFDAREPFDQSLNILREDAET
ncbi:MAG: hypothetical protein A3F26_00920 [Candidatus Ryanbacteria bacterium RIFCSPHIGHO2_12_FULL_47_12b]|uniref:Ribulose-phosphate 3-epimerase n=2 Tax=Candidatus Ryaniibacteriota TaxID=1817914 RepID=A0A1G2H595_9BACT|nr:MAG: Ribulose-phosphate 3-epimerase [Parcubacteria group bacterium GW2011_GWA2_47_10b]OGZ46516.1 MAG: hypothetical protein A2844_01355 [Candidatus Ryanbacteria bacterium RIFCSPHIGHO2_01_FULL_48_80]OGZ48615.1 MAG: hypothetical protein A3C83_00845 [Candidatus Ryanbacteria bacterium RIFCSPHIGHO2_02_FULL_47_25]OGZ52523.1 MAG: hypothetical protein A3F26_00920 [Candidatus Ryanbacteria bacterium RIFCSPHIGHO2_12_FULL_47_12b]OGZ52936.1 MAG: hypothetical protein A3A29_01900 [Candidatus Ryanbacteria ba